MIELFLACVASYEAAYYDEVYVDREWAAHVLELDERELSSEFVLGEAGIEDIYCYRLAQGKAKETPMTNTIAYRFR